MAKKQREYILCAAIHYCDGKEYAHQPFNVSSGIVICGMRHCNCLAILASLLGIGNYNRNLLKQGFLTSHNRYVDRAEALEIATAANQVRARHLPEGLDSSDLY